MPSSNPQLSTIAPHLWQIAFQTAAPDDLNLMVNVWKSVPPPLGLLSDGDEGESEIDVVIESATWVWFIEAKYRSDISTGTTTRPGRDQILRNVDVGSYYAGVRDFYFSLLISSEQRSPLGAEKIVEYARPGAIRRKLVHRPDGLVNLRQLSKITWSQLMEVLSYSERGAEREEERLYASRAFSWLRSRLIQ